MRHRTAVGERPLHWVGAARRDLMTFPGAVVREMGWALGVAQFGEMHPAAKPWKGAGPRIMEIAVSYEGNAYRVVYATAFEPAIYVLHCFQKKSPRGIKTARTDIALVSRRLMAARTDWKTRYG
jgi:phage-related protein